MSIICKDCKGSGTILINKETKVCPTCNGVGTIPFEIKVEHILHLNKRQ